MTNQTKPVLKMTLRGEAKIIDDIESGSAIIINVVSVAGGSAKVKIGSFLTGTEDERKTDPQQQALSLFTNALARMISEGIDGGLSDAVVARAIKADPKVMRVFEPSMPEELLKIFDESETYAEAMNKLKDSSLNAECDCPSCKKEREEEAAKAAQEVAEGNVTVN